ncbi:MAG: hypothetical protein SVM80_04840 [Halobacteriota archaeon]|nr:hypothetical protein [Halobacteriota archaeon]
MPLFNFDEEFATAVIQALRYLFEYLGMLLKSVVVYHPENHLDVSGGVWGAIYWLIGILNMLIESIFTSKVVVTMEDIVSADLSNIIDFVIYCLELLLRTLVSNEGGMTTNMVYHLFEFLSYLVTSIGGLMELLPSVLPFA